MFNGKRLLIGVLCGLCLLPWGALPAQASDACSIREATQRERTAARALERARTRYRTACAVTRQTKAATEQYGRTVGRWVWLAADVGWPRGTWGQLLYVIHRESRGYPQVVNSWSGCTGLLQILPSNVDEPWRLDEPRYNLKQGLRLYRSSGWSPWAL